MAMVRGAKFVVMGYPFRWVRCGPRLQARDQSPASGITTTKGPLSLFGAAGLHCLTCKVWGVSPALPVARHHDGQHAHGGGRIVRGLSPVAEIRVCFIEINLPEHGLAPDLDCLEIVPAFRVILRLEGVELTSGLHRLGHKAVTGLHKRAGDMHPALDGLRGWYPEAGKLAERVVLRRDHGRIWTVWLGLNDRGHGDL